MRRTLLSLSVLTCVMTLAGCANPFGQQGYLRDKSGDYTVEQAAEPIQLPEGANTKDLGDILVVPETGQAWQQLPREFEIPRPAQRLSMKEGDNFSLERDGVEEWLLTAKSPAEVWPGVLSFLEQNDVSATSQNPATGIIETSWADFGEDKEHGVMYRTFGSLVGVDDLEPMEDRFRFEIRDGTEENTSEVHVSHQGRPLTKEGKTPTPAPEEWDNLGSRSKKLGEGVLGELLIYLAHHDMNASVSKVAQSLNVSDFADLANDGNGNPVLTIRDLSYARVWAKVSEALDHAGLTVVDRNRSAGIFYLSEDPQKIDKPAEEKGFWSGLFSSDGKKTEDGVAKPEALTVRVSNFPEVVQVSVEKNVNTSAPADVSEKLLKVILDNLK
ncbi:hypothetical protein ACH42_02010 [Endozoicomonas sp. (ex Bugula neritina AB1)]|nr:hypothetical protein ACH42_02010 [Endozoicomonas sp. (ex Bugula neritina AB1)]